MAGPHDALLQLLIEDEEFGDDIRREVGRHWKSLLPKVLNRITRQGGAGKISVLEKAIEEACKGTMEKHLATLIKKQEFKDLLKKAVEENLADLAHGMMKRALDKMIEQADPYDY
jgi:hypothetical protein